ncbi:MAG: glycine zipper family protein [Myxococcota bacterium]
MSLVSALLAFPTVVFTGLLGVVLVYWLSVMVGALDIDMFDGDAVFEGADGALEGADGAIDGALNGADGVLDGALKGADGMLDGMGEGADAIDAVAGAKDGGAEAVGNATGLLHVLKLRRAPITVTFSFIVFFGWVASYLFQSLLGPLVSPLVPGWVAGVAFLLASFAIALPLTSLATKPLERVFKTQGANRRTDYIGSVCAVRSGQADATFGQAEVTLGYDHMIIPVRIDVGTLRKGQRGLIVDYDEEREAYIIEAYDQLLASEQAESAARQLDS